MQQSFLLMKTVNLLGFISFRFIELLFLKVLNHNYFIVTFDIQFRYVTSIR